MGRLYRERHGFLGTCQRIVTLRRKVSRTCRGDVAKMSRDVADVSRTCRGRVAKCREMSRTCREVSRDVVDVS